eukprot:CAMPEP_0174726712 /NCGR_PEP_ID=MMETSP1094-20130205/48395_1 /TAXON_ID=156173 /ORGANISM="Chrysochromulina brevifilum, Strain UTEX LB 985" /LENGTH=79 /DNA_ID=CAMNT_0015928333 /DNA_START=204 /DNA_END=443 /DNA_ORIENTATION=+
MASVSFWRKGPGAAATFLVRKPRISASSDSTVASSLLFNAMKSTWRARLAKTSTLGAVRFLTLNSDEKALHCSTSASAK